MLKLLFIGFSLSLSLTSFAQSGSGQMSVCCKGGNPISINGTTQGYCTGTTLTPSGASLDFGGRCQAMAGVCATSCGREANVKGGEKGQCRNGSMPVFIVNSPADQEKCEKQGLSYQVGHTQKFCCPN